MYSDENKARLLAKQLNYFDYAIVDTSSLMEDSFPIWMDSLLNAQTYLDDSPVEIYIPDECIEELKNHCTDKKNFDKSSSAKRALKIIRHAKRKKVLSLLKTYGNDTEHHFADKAIYVKVSADRLNQRILVVTQDKKLASDLRGLNDLMSQHGNRVQVYRLDRDGSLVPNRGEIIPEEHRSKPAERNVPRPNNNRGDAAPVNKAFPKPQNQEDATIKAIEKMDAHLGSNLKNRQYPTERKIEDVTEQMKNLKNLKDEKKAKLRLLVPEKQLRQELINLQSAAIPAKKEAEKSAKQESTVDSISILKKKMRFGSGNSLQSAIQEAASWCGGILFRYPTIPYQAQFHGPLDLTENDLDEIVKRLEDKMDGRATVSTDYKGLTVLAEPYGIGFKAWASLTKNFEEDKPNSNAASLPKNELEKRETPKRDAPSKKEQPALPTGTKTQRTVKKVKKKAQAPAVEKTAAKVDEPPAPKPEDKPADFGHPKLVILAPEDKDKRERIEAKIRYEKSPVPATKAHSSKKKSAGSNQKVPVRSPKKGQKGMGPSQPKPSTEKKKSKSASQSNAELQQKKKAVVKKVVKKVPASKPAPHPQTKQNASSQKKKSTNQKPSKTQPSKSDASKPNGK